MLMTFFVNVLLYQRCLQTGLGWHLTLIIILLRDQYAFFNYRKTAIVANSIISTWWIFTQINKDLMRR